MTTDWSADSESMFLYAFEAIAKTCGGSPRDPFLYNSSFSLFKTEINNNNMSHQVKRYVLTEYKVEGAWKDSRISRWKIYSCKSGLPWNEFSSCAKLTSHLNLKYWLDLECRSLELLDYNPIEATIPIGHSFRLISSQIGTSHSLDSSGDRFLFSPSSVWTVVASPC